MDLSSSLLEEITRLQNSYYTSNAKNTIFKQKQKEECASVISNNFELQKLLNAMCFVIPNTNKLFVDYTVFKTFANADNYDIIVNHIFTLVNDIAIKYNIYSVHVNLSTFSISACHRYKDIIQLYINKCIIMNTGIINKVSKLHIYNTPSSIESIRTFIIPLTSHIIRNKFVTYSKEESIEMLKQLFL
jgi:hypothetical protein